jgi:hypothetical protein
MTKAEQRKADIRKLKYGSRLNLPVSSRPCVLCSHPALRGDAVVVRESCVAHEKCLEKKK